MNCFFIDTSSDLLTIAVVSDNKVLAEKSCESIGEHSKYAMVGMSEVLEKAKLKPNSIDKIIVVNGPGSWTGIRIGVTIAKVYAWALNKEVIPLSSLKAYSLSSSGYDNFISVIDARRNHVYAGVYDKNHNNVIEESYMDIDSLNNIIDKLKGTVVIMGNINVNDKHATIPVKLDVLNIVNKYINKEGI